MRVNRAMLWSTALLMMSLCRLGPGPPFELVVKLNTSVWEVLYLQSYLVLFLHPFFDIFVNNASRWRWCATENAWPVPATALTVEAYRTLSNHGTQLLLQFIKSAPAAT
jgi:hypothetical protein